MIAELVHTSMVKGLDGGTGFAVAARTGGMPRALADALSALSGLGEAWPGATDEQRTLRATRAIDWQGETAWVASVVRPCGVDHTGRGNRIAHHRVLDAGEVARVDPVAVLLDGAWREAWRGEARELDAPVALPASAGHAGPCETWRRVFGDAGVAAAALEPAFRSGVGAWIVVPAGAPREQLLRELVGLLPAANRWKRGWATRPVRPAAGEAPVICVVDAREPEVERAPTGAAWRIDAAALAPVAAEALLRRAREGAASDASSSSSAAAKVARVSVAPPRRLEAPGEAAPARTQPTEAAPAAGHDAHEQPIRVEIVRPARSGAWRWIALACVAVAALLWWMLRGGGA